MDNLVKLQDNIKNNFKLWLLVWFLLLMNIYTFISLRQGFSWAWTIFFITLALLGSGLLKMVSHEEVPELITLPELQASISSLMREIIPLCDAIFVRETNQAINPVLEDLEKEFSKGLAWLWENIDDFIADVLNSIEDHDSVLHIFTTLTSEKSTSIESLENSSRYISEVILQVKQAKKDDFDMLLKNLNSHRDSLLEDMEKEKEIFYQHINHILLENSEKEDDFNPVEHFNTYKLGEQFASLVNKSIQEKIEGFNEIALEHLAELSTDVVGRMQKNTTNLLNAFRDNQAVLERLLNDCKGESDLLLRRIDELLIKNNELQEKASQILLTLAWQDILIEKRWQEVKNKLYLVRDMVQNSVEAEVLDYIKEVVEGQIPGISYNVRQAEGTIFYKGLLDAELIYQIYVGRKLTDIIGDGVHVLMQFVRPIEMLVHHNVRLNEQGVQMRKGMRKGAKLGEFDDTFVKIEKLLEDERPHISPYLEGIFPQEFYAFLNSPYIKKKPENTAMAAWSIFLSLTEKAEKDELYILVGLLLVVNKLRNKYIHPLKNTLIEVENDEDIEVMRDCAYYIANLITHNELKGITSLSYKYK